MAAAISNAVTAAEIVVETAAVDAGAAAEVAVVVADVREDLAAGICLLRNTLPRKAVNATIAVMSRAATAVATISAVPAVTLAATGRKAAATASRALHRGQPVRQKTTFFFPVNRSQNSAIVRQLPPQ